MLLLLENRSPLTLLRGKILPRSESSSKAGWSVRSGFDHKVECEAVHQCRNLFDCIQTAFRPNLAELRRLDEFAEGMAVSLMDNCPGQITDDVM
jgi:hypothetical protein